MKIKNVVFYISFLLISSIVSITPLHANEGAQEVVRERMDKFKISKKMMQTIHKEMTKYFPEGSDGAPSEASADIWLDPEGFKKAVNNFELASLKLINNSKEKDFDNTVDSFRSLAGTCKGCHQKFRN